MLLIEDFVCARYTWYVLLSYLHVSILSETFPVTEEEIRPRRG